MNKDQEELLKNIADLIIKYEEKYGNNRCAVGCSINFIEDDLMFYFNGEKFRKKECC